MKKEKKEYLIKAVERAIRVIDELANASEPELGISEISRRVNLHKNNVFRILATLETLGYVEQNRATENYRLSTRFLALGESFRKKLDMFEEKRKLVDRVADETGESTYLCMVYDGQVFHVYGKASSKPVRVDITTVESIPAERHVSSQVVGKEGVIPVEDRASFEDVLSIAFPIPVGERKDALVIYVPLYRAEEETVRRIKETGTKIVKEFVEKMRVV